MPADLKSKWTTALLSGEFAQGSGRLRRGDKLCCLGVLCEIDDRIIRHDAPKVWLTDREQYEIEYCCEGCDGEYNPPADGPARETIPPEDYEYDYSLPSEYDPDELLSSAIPSYAMVELWAVDGRGPTDAWGCRIDEETEPELFAEVLEYASCTRDFDSDARYIDADLASLNDNGAPFSLIAKVIEAKF
jgi:hypothetical protein